MTRALIIHALEFGLVLSIALGASLVIVGRVNPEILLNDYPPDVRAKWGPMTARTKRQRTFVVAALLIEIVAIIAWSVATLPTSGARTLGFSDAFIYFAIIFGTFNVFDLLVIDAGLVVLQPPFAVLPGTEGLPGYRDYRFHVGGFLIGIPVVLLGSAIAAGVLLLVLHIY